MRACLRTLNGVLNRCIRWTLMGLIRLAFRPKISYVSDRARQEAFRSPMIMVSNHVRGMDGAALCTLFPGKKIHGVSAKEFMDKPALGWLLRRLGCVSVDRDHVTVDWLRQCRRILVKDQEHVYICPEGKCNFQKQIQPFKPAVGNPGLSWRRCRCCRYATAGDCVITFSASDSAAWWGNPSCCIPRKEPWMQRGSPRKPSSLEQEMFRLRDLLEAKR